MTLLETYIPVFQFREFHELLVQAAPADLLDAVSLPGIMEDPWVKGFIRPRERRDQPLIRQQGAGDVDCGGGEPGGAAAPSD
jgi:hypothetical protein